MLAQTAVFPLHQLQDTSARVCHHIAQQDQPVLHVIRGGDGSWIFLCGRDHAADHHEGIALPLKEMIKNDPSLNAISGLAPHDYAERPTADEPWTQGDQLALEIPTCIEEHGWFIALVGDESSIVPKHFAYTIGMPTTQNHPELIMLGLSPDAMPTMLNTLGARIAKGQLFSSVLATPIQGLTCQAKPVHPTWYRDYLGYGLWYHGDENFEVMQVFWPDNEGRYPWNADCDPEVIGMQPNLSLAKQ